VSFFAELKRRNVIRVGGLYIVTGWLLIQVDETLLPAFGAPDWVLRVLVILIAIGFVPALMFSWVFELTPEGLKRDAADGQNPETRAAGQRRLDIATMLVAGLAIALLLGDRLWPQKVAPAPSVQQDVAAAVAPSEAQGGRGADAAGAGSEVIDESSIAVLPFVNMSADKDNEYFSDGISEELLNVLVKVEGLSVASRTSSFAYKGREQSAASIGEELKVAHVLEGSVRKSGSRVRITAQLIDASSDRHLWSETYDRELTDIFAIQDEIAKAIVAALRETLGDRISAPTVAVTADTDNLDAYQLYLKARELFFARKQLDESVRLFEQVVMLDPEFARGWEGLAAASAVIVDWVGSYPTIDRDALLLRAEEAAGRALTLDPNLSMPWATRSLVAGYVRPVDYAKQIELIDRAIVADARNATAFLWRGIYWVALGFMERALADFNQCLEIDPAYGNCQRWKAVVILFKGQTDDAIALYQEGMAKGFNDNRGNSFVEPLIRRGDRFAAILLMREIGWPVEAQQVVMASVGDGLPSPSVRALADRYPDVARRQWHWGLLLRDYALAAETDKVGTTYIEHWDPAYEGLRATPAFKRMLEHANVPAYWRAKGFPPQCRALGDDDFECDQPAPSR